jgi:hypothetical protein
MSSNRATTAAATSSSNNSSKNHAASAYTNVASLSAPSMTSPSSSANAVTTAQQQQLQSPPSSAPNHNNNATTLRQRRMMQNNNNNNNINTNNSSSSTSKICTDAYQCMCLVPVYPHYKQEYLEYNYHPSYNSTTNESTAASSSNVRIRHRGEYYIDSYNDQSKSFTFGTNENVRGSLFVLVLLPPQRCCFRYCC